MSDKCEKKLLSVPRDGPGDIRGRAISPERDNAAVELLGPENGFRGRGQGRVLVREDDLVRAPIRGPARDNSAADAESLPERLPELLPEQLRQVPDDRGGGADLRGAAVRVEGQDAGGDGGDVAAALAHRARAHREFSAQQREPRGPDASPERGRE